MFVRLGQVAIERALEKKSITEKSNTRDTVFYPVVRPSNTCLLPRCGVPIDEGCTQPLSSDPMIHLNTTIFFLIVDVPFVGNLHKLESLTLTILISMKTTRVREGKKHTQKLESQQRHAHKSREEHTNTAQQVHNSTSAQISITIIRMRACGV
jgi:hypothetical protein